MSSISTETLGFHARMSRLEMKLKQSEDERMRLEEQFNKFLRSNKSKDTMWLRQDYCRLLDQDRLRCERNDHIMRTLSHVESRASAFTAKTDRLRLLRSHYESYLDRNYPSWKNGSTRSHSADREPSTKPWNTALSLFGCSRSPSITRKSSLIVPDSQLLEYSKYKFASETDIESPSFRPRLFVDSPRKIDDPNSATVLSRPRSYSDVFRDCTVETSNMLKNEQNTSNDSRDMSFSENNSSQYLPIGKENLPMSSDNYKSTSVFDQKDRTPPSRTVRSVPPRPVSSYKPLTRSRRLYATSSNSSRPTSISPPEKRSVLTRRSSVVYQTSVSVQSESSFSSANVSRLSSPRVSRSVSPIPDYTKSKQNPLQVVDDIFKKYLINYDQRYLCDPISESKYGKYLYPSKHRENHFEGNMIHSPTYTLTSRLSDYNFSYPESQSYLPPKNIIKTNRFDSYGSNESLPESNYTYNHYREIEPSTYSNINDWKDWSYYRDRYEYIPELGFKDSQCKLDYPHDYRSNSKPYSVNDVKVPTSHILLDNSASRFAEPSSSFAHQLAKSSSTSIPSIVEEPISTASNHGGWNYRQLSEPENYATFKASLKPPTTPKKVSFSNNNLDYDKTNIDESLSAAKDFRQLAMDELTSNKKESDEINYKSGDFQDMISDTHYDNVDAKINGDKCQSGEIKTYEYSTKGHVDQDSYDSPLQGGEGDWKTTSRYSIEDLTVDISDLSKKSNDLVESQEATSNSDFTDTKFNEEILNEKENDASLNPTENIKFGIYSSEEKLNEDKTSKVSAPFSDIDENVDGIQIYNVPTNEQKELRDKVDEKDFLDKDLTAVLQQNELVCETEISPYDSTPNEQMTQEYNINENKPQRDLNEYKGEEYIQEPQASTNNIQNTVQDEFATHQYIEDPSLERFPENQTSEQYNESDKQYNEQLSAEYQQQANDEYDLNEQPYSSEHQQQATDEYDLNGQPYSSEHQQQATDEYDLNGQPYSSEHQQQATDEYDLNGQPYSSEQYGQGHVPQEYQQTEEYITRYGDGYQQPAEYERSEYDQQNTQYGQRSVEYVDDTFRQSSPQERQSALQDNGYIQQTQAESMRYDVNSYANDQEPGGSNAGVYGRQNIPDQQTGYGGYVQDQQQPTGFEENYKQQVPQAGYDQSPQDLQQIPTELYQGDDYVQDRQGQDSTRGINEYLPDRYESQPTGQEYSQPQNEGEYQADFAQKHQYQDDHAQGQQYVQEDYNASYQNDPNYRYQQENTTYDQTKQEQYQYDQSGEQYQQQYDGGEQYGNNYDYKYDNESQGQAYGEMQNYAQEQVYDDTNTEYDENAQQQYQQSLVSGESRPHDVQYMEGYPDQSQLDTSQSQDAAGYGETPELSKNAAPTGSEPPPPADLSRVLESDSESGPAPTAVTHDDSSDFDFTPK